MKPMKTQLLKLAKLIVQERELSNKITELRQKLMKFDSHQSCITPLGMTLTIPVSDWLQVEAPDGRYRPKPTLELFQGEHFPTPYGKLHYPGIWVGEISNGQNLWVEAWSERFDLPQSTPQAIAVNA